VSYSNPTLYQRFNAAAALAAIGTILVLSLVPGVDRPHILRSGNLEHLIAYAGTGFLIAAGLPPLRRWRGVLMLVVLSALLEIAQLVIPGRTAGIDNWFSSSLGAFLGMLAYYTVTRQRAAMRYFSGNG